MPRGHCRERGRLRTQYRRYGVPSRMATGTRVPDSRHHRNAIHSGLRRRPRGGSVTTLGGCRWCGPGSSSMKRASPVALMVRRRAGTWNTLSLSPRRARSGHSCTRCGRGTGRRAVGRTFSREPAALAPGVSIASAARARAGPACRRPGDTCGSTRRRTGRARSPRKSSRLSAWRVL